MLEVSGKQFTDAITSYFAVSDLLAVLSGLTATQLFAITDGLISSAFFCILF